jgi:(1->4)-alpha-D-glucan 1-alpha-D-glucosylmutase
MEPVLATYRLQLHAGFPLSQARALVPYLSGLGISHIHCSPLLRARTGSTHGYDVTEPRELNPELGTEEDLAGLVADLRAHRMGLVLDIVPNHMAASSENPAWEDVLMHGPASRYARWFDIEWRAAERELRFRVLLPVLGDQRARVLQRNEITLALEKGRIRLRYYEHSFPLDPATIPLVLDRAIPECERLLPGDPASEILRDIARKLRRMPRRSVRRQAAIVRRQEVASEELKRLRELGLRVPQVDLSISSAAADFGNGAAGVERLRRLLDAQVYRLAHWRRAARELNYRRFFDVNDLVALHMEDPEVLAETHALALAWRHRDWIDGFRIDHPDGLLDPREYFRRLGAQAFPAWSGGAVPIYVEKILAPGERLREEWPVAGTTGYDFLNQVEALFISPKGYGELEQEYRRIIRQPLDFPAIARLAKRQVQESGLSAGVRRLAERLLKLAGPDRPLPSVKTTAFARAIVETIASLPVYRTYVDPTTPVPREEDRRLLEAALADAAQRGRASATAVEMLGAALLGTDGPMRQAGTEGLRLRFVQRFQQLSGPAAAKGIEDTAFYSYAPLLSRSEVGGGPESALSVAVADFHEGCRARAERWPQALLATTTHDTKRTADVRSRLDVLSEIPQEWNDTVDRWRRTNQVHKRTVGERRDPDPNTVHHLLQAVVGVWPLELTDLEAAGPTADHRLAGLRDRLKEYAIKAAREAKLRTNWTEPDAEFEAALQDYVEAILCPDRSAEFLDDLARFVVRIAHAGLRNSLSRTLLHLTAPGIPDLYQGDELWNLALVDPDNRRPVDFDRRRQLLHQVASRFADPGQRHQLLEEMLLCPEDGRLKLHLIRAVLHARRDRAELFRFGSYEQLGVDGPAREQVIAFARQYGAQRAVVVASRMGGIGPLNPRQLWVGSTVQLPGGWLGEWVSVLSGDVLRRAAGGLDLAEVFGVFPAALLLG